MYQAFYCCRRVHNAYSLVSIAHPKCPVAGNNKDCCKHLPIYEIKPQMFMKQYMLNPFSRLGLLTYLFMKTLFNKC